MSLLVSNHRLAEGRASAVPCTVVLLVSMILSAGASALNSDRDQPILIDSDRSEAGAVEGVLVFDQNVTITQGSLVIQADRAEMRRARAGDVQSVRIIGQPARLRQTLEGERGDMNARANTIDYDMGSELLVLRGDVEIIQQGATMNSDLVEYEIATGRVRGGGTERVRMRIEARTLDPKPNTEE